MPDYLIRDAHPDDAEAMLVHIRAINAEPNNGIIRGPGEEPTLEEERHILAGFAAADNAVMKIAVTPSGEVIGMAGFQGGKRRAVRHAGGIGISVSQAWREQGVGTALMQQLIAWARATGIIQRMELEVNVENERALHVYRKLGFQIEGRKQAALYKEGRYLDNYVMALLFT